MRISYSGLIWDRRSIPTLSCVTTLKINLCFAVFLVSRPAPCFQGPVGRALPMITPTYFVELRCVLQFLFSPR